jgi:hypothetical protein
MLAALGLLLLQAGWSALDRVFPASADVTPAVLSTWRPGVSGDVGTVFERLTAPVRVVTAPFRALFGPRTGASAFAHAALAALWATAVWGLVGGAVARIAVVALARGERVGMRSALRFTAGKAGPLVGAPLVPVLGVVVIAAPIALFGLLYRIPGAAGATAAGALAFLPLLGGLVLTLIVIGLAAGWPLMHASIAAEAEDAFDAVSRSYAYVHQRPWNYAAYAALTLAAGGVGLVFVELFASLVVTLTLWALGFGGPSGIVGDFFINATEGATLASAAAAHGFWLGAVGLLVQAWAYSYFWTAATAVYLLLRRDVDGTPFGAVAYKSPPSLLAEAAAESEAEAAAVSHTPSTAVPAPHAPGVREPDTGGVSGV